MGLQSVILFVMCFSALAVHGNLLEDDHYVTAEWKEYLEKLKEIYEENKAEVDRNNRTLDSIGLDFFNISFEGKTEPVTVHSLGPQDIDVVAALGDSITAGTGIDANTVFGLAIQFRGLSWTVGGDGAMEDTLTIPNLLRRFNPEVKGHSVGRKITGDIIEKDWFNVAVPGARARNMLDQTENLIELMKSDQRTSYENDWKLISVFIGGNDLCAIGRDPTGASPEVYLSELKSALDLMHSEIPRALVQIVQIMEIYVLPQVSNGFGAYLLCNLTQQLVCGHVVDAVENVTTLEELKEKNWEYQNLVKDLIESGIYDTRDDFTVVIQPFLEDTHLPLTEDGQVDATYFAPDCFHFSSKGHALGAVNVWNNMFERVGEKSTELEIRDLICPTDDSPYIFTRMNSNETKRKQRESRNVVDNYEACPEKKCKTTPDWLVGVTCTLLALLALQVFILLMMLQSKKEQSSSAYESDKSVQL